MAHSNPAHLPRGQGPTSSSVGTTPPKRTASHPAPVPCPIGRRISPPVVQRTDFVTTKQAAVTSSRHSS